MASYIVRQFSAAESRQLLDQIVDVYRAVFARPPYNSTEQQIAEFKSDWQTRSTRAGFQFFGAVDLDAAGPTTAVSGFTGKLVGFTYGWISTPGDYWHHQFEKALGTEADYWLSDCFEYVDLAVAPKAQGAGLGRKLSDELFTYVSNKTALLLTHPTQTIASGMYERDGWKKIGEFTGHTGTLKIMGRVLKS